MYFKDDAWQFLLSFAEEEEEGDESEGEEEEEQEIVSFPQQRKTTVHNPLVDKEQDN